MDMIMRWQSVSRLGFGMGTMRGPKDPDAGQSQHRYDTVTFQSIAAAFLAGDEEESKPSRISKKSEGKSAFRKSNAEQNDPTRKSHYLTSYATILHSATDNYAAPKNEGD